MAGEDGRVDMAVVSKRLERCQQLEAIDLSAYLEAYRDLYRFFRRMGRLFEFVASDVISKIEILEKYVESENGAHYETVEGMLRYEKEIGSAGGGKKAPSGSRTLLRLHRALEFIVILLDKFAALGDDEATGPSAEAAYLATIAPFHIWLVRKGALFAVRRLPTLRQLVEKTTVHSVQQFKTLIPDTVRLGRRVYDLTQDTYGRSLWTMRRRRTNSVGSPDDLPPYGGKVVMAKRKKPEHWTIVVIQVVALSSAFWLVYVACFHTSALQFQVARFYAHLGHGHAQHLLGQKYLQGYGVDADEERALFWFKKAAEQGHPSASYDWAIAHLRGMHDHIEKSEAHRLIRHAARHGVPEARRFLEHICPRGECPPEDDPTSTASLLGAIA